MKHVVPLLEIILVTCWLLAISTFPIGGSTSVGVYIGNIRTYVFHRQSCRHLPSVKNRSYFDTRQRAIDAGYRPCRKCRP